MIRELRMGFTAGRGPGGALIRRVDADVLPTGEEVPSAVNHVLLRAFYTDGLDLVFQSHGIRGVGICFTTDVQRAVSEGRVFRYAEYPLNLQPMDMTLADCRMRHLSGAGYDHWQICLYYAAARLGFERLVRFGNDRRFTCNEAVFEVLKGLSAQWEFEWAPTPTQLFAHVFGEPSSVYFKHHRAVDFH